MNRLIALKDMADLKNKLLLKCKSFDLKQLYQDVEPFLFVPSDSKKKLFFCEYIQQYEF